MVEIKDMLLFEKSYESEKDYEMIRQVSRKYVQIREELRKYSYLRSVTNPLTAQSATAGAKVSLQKWGLKGGTPVVRYPYFL